MRTPEDDYYLFFKPVNSRADRLMQDARRTLKEMQFLFYGLPVTFTACQTGEPFYPLLAVVIAVYLIFFRK